MTNTYFIAVNYVKDGNIMFQNFCYEIDYELDSPENIEKTILDLRQQTSSKNLSIVFFKKLNNEGCDE